VKIVFNVIEQQAGNGRHCDRRGVCTGWLNDLTLPMLSQSDSLERTVGDLALTDSKPVVVHFYFIVCYFRLLAMCIILMFSTVRLV